MLNNTILLRIMRLGAAALISLLVTVFVARPTAGQSADLKYLMGDFDPATHAQFVEIDKKYTAKDKIYLRKEAYKAYEKMYADALAATQVKLEIISATRNFTSQKGIWVGKWNDLTNIEDPKQRALEILKYSSMPGSSRHHWGTDMDLVNLNNSYFDSGDGAKVYTWLKANAASYGFCQPYTPLTDAGRSGYQEEKWHWSYKLLSKGFTKDAGTMIRNLSIKGFSGSETAASIDVVKNYITGVSSNCKQ